MRSSEQKISDCGLRRLLRMLGGDNKYGLQIRKPRPSKPIPAPQLRSIFNPDDDEDDVENDIARQALKKRSLLEVEKQHKRALEEDPSIFDYDGVYDKMKSDSSRPRSVDLVEKKPKYITKLIEKAKIREQEHDVVYERKLAKERAQEDHLYADKEKFITGAYKKKLAEQAKWLEEERRRQLKEEADEVTKKSDLSDFYRNLLSKNEAFGAGRRKEDAKVGTSQEEQPLHAPPPMPSNPIEVLNRGESDKEGDTALFARSDEEERRGNVPSKAFDAPPQPSVKLGGMQADRDNSRISSPKADVVAVAEESRKTPKDDRKPNEVALTAARERYLARKRNREP